MNELALYKLYNEFTDDNNEMIKKISEILDEKTSESALRKLIEYLDMISSKYISDVSIINDKYASEQNRYIVARDKKIDTLKREKSQDIANIEHATKKRVDIISKRTNDINDKKARMQWAEGGLLKKIKERVKGSAIRKCRGIGKEIADMAEVPSTVEILKEIECERKKFINQIEQYYKERIENIENECQTFINAEKSEREKKVSVLKERIDRTLNLILCDNKLIEKFKNIMEKRILFADYKYDNYENLPEYYDLGYISLEVPSNITSDKFLSEIFHKYTVKWVENRVLHGNVIRVPLIVPRQTGYSIVLPCYDTDEVTSFILRNSMLFPVGKMLFTIICAPLKTVFSPINGIEREEIRLTGDKYYRTEREIENKLKEINDTILGLSNNYFGSVEQREKKESFQTVFIYDYDMGINEKSKKYLRDMVEDGPASGVNFVFFCDYIDDVDKSVWGNAIVVRKKNGTYGGPLYYVKYKNYEYRYELGEVITINNYRNIIKSMSKHVGINDVINYRLDELIPQWRDVGTYCMCGTAANVIDVPIAFIGTSTFNWVIGKSGSDDRHHTMIEGTTGNGKTELIQAILLSVFYKYPPDEVQVCFMDYKDGVGEQYFKNTAYTKKIIAQGDRQAGCVLLKDCIDEITNRYEEFIRVGVEDIYKYREQTKNKMPRVIIIVEELSGLIKKSDSISTDVVGYISEIAQRGRAAGYHLILTAQGFKDMSLSEDVERNFTHRFTCNGKGKCTYTHYTETASEGSKTLNTVYVRGDIPEFLSVLSQYTSGYEDEADVATRIISGDIEDHRVNPLNSFDIDNGDGDMCTLHMGYYVDDDYRLALSPTNSSLVIVCPENTKLVGLISDSCTIITYILLSIMQNGILKYDLSKERDFISIVAIEPAKKYEKELEKVPIRFADYIQYACADGDSEDEIYEEKIQAIKGIIRNLYEVYKKRSEGEADYNIPKYLVFYGLHRTKPLRGDKVFDVNTNPLIDKNLDSSNDYMCLLKELIRNGGKYNIFVIAWTDKNYERLEESFNCKDVLEMFSTIIASAMGERMIKLVDYDGDNADSERHAFIKRKKRAEGHEISLFQMPTDKWIDDFSEKCRRKIR